MARKHRSHLRSLAYAILSAALAACLIVTPLCAARCATTFCIPAATDNSTDSCHHSLSRHDAAPTLATASSTSRCAQGELLFTPPRLQKLSPSIRLFAVSTFALSTSDVGQSLPLFASELGGTTKFLTLSYASNLSALLPLRL
jgi:hypothetical protein